MQRVLVWLTLCGCNSLFNLDRVVLPRDSGVGGDVTDLSDASDTLDASDAATPTCGPVRNNVIAVYPVDGDASATQLTDTGGNNIHGSSNGAIAVATAAPNCDLALQIESGREVTIPYDTRFQLASGSFDVWVKPIAIGSANESRVIVARDNGGNNAGDLSLFEHRLSGGQLIFVVRLQSGNTASPGGGSYRCSSAITADKWYHVAVNVGPLGLSLLVDNVLQTATDTITINNEANSPCGGSTSGQIHTVGIDGASGKSWFLGFGDLAVGRRYLTGGAIDHFRVSSDRY